MSPISVRSAQLPEPRADAVRKEASYSAVILARPAEITLLKDQVRRLVPGCDQTLLPSFFLASLSKGWIPRVAVVRRGGELAGVVYAKERGLAGVPLGLIYADNSFGNVVVAGAYEREQVLQAAIRQFLAHRRVRGLRLVVPPGGYEARCIDGMVSSLKLEAGYMTSENHARLALPPSYAEFLRTLGSRTRRNFRYYVKQCSAEGHSYEERLSPEDLHAAAWDLRTKCRIATSRDALTRTLTWLSAAGRPFAVGLRHREGGWLSVAAGWYGCGSATLALQLNNDQEFGALSLSVAMRARLIETLIRQGIGDLWFWAGTSPPLARYATYLRTTGVYLDRPDPGWRLVRYLAATVGPLLPKQIAADLVWIARPAAQARVREVPASKDEGDILDADAAG